MAERSRPGRDEILERYRAVRVKIGRAPGWDTLVKVAGLRKADVLYYWPRLGDLAIETGGTPNQLQAALSDDEVFTDYARVCLHLGHLPTSHELPIAARAVGARAHETVVGTRFGSIAEFDRRFRSWLGVAAPAELHAILDMPGWERKGRARPARVLAVTPAFHPFLPANLQYLDALALGERPPHETADGPASLIFERRCGDAFRALGFEVTTLGQGKGRAPDFAAVSRRDRYGVIVDAKLRGAGYVLGTDDRTYYEYVATQTTKLRNDGLDKIYLALVSADFRERDVTKLAEYLAGSDVRGITFFTARAVMRVVEDSIRERATFTLGDFEKVLFGNRLIHA